MFWSLVFTRNTTSECQKGDANEYYFCNAFFGIPESFRSIFRAWYSLERRSSSFYSSSNTIGSADDGNFELKLANTA